MYYFVKKNISIILFFIPLSFVIGVAITEFLVLLSIIFFLIFNRDKTQFSNPKIIFLFLFSTYIFINSFFQIDVRSKDLLVSSLFHFRFVIFAISIFYISELMNDFKNKKYFLMFNFFLLILMIDAVFQFFNGSNVFGYEIIGGRVSSFFKDELVLGSFNSIPLVEKFDFVLAFGALHHSSNLQKTLDECFKALKPGGHLIAQEPYSSDETPNSFFVEMKNKKINVQGLIEIKNKLRDDNFYRKCEYLTASYHAGFDNLIFKKLSDIKSQFSKFFNSKLNPTNNALLILNKSKTIDTKEIPNRWT